MWYRCRSDRRQRKCSRANGVHSLQRILPGEQKRKIKKPKFTLASSFRNTTFFVCSIRQKTEISAAGRMPQKLWEPEVPCPSTLSFGWWWIHLRNISERDNLVRVDSLKSISGKPKFYFAFCYLTTERWPLFNLFGVFFHRCLVTVFFCFAREYKLWNLL